MKLDKLFVSFILFIPIYSIATAKYSTKPFKCLSPKEITKKDVSFGKFEYIMKIPGTNITLHSKPMYKWIENKPASFIKDTIEYSSKEGIIDCIYRTDSVGSINNKNSNEIEEIDLEYRDPKHYNYQPNSPKIWKKVVSNKIECDESIKGCEIKPIPKKTIKEN